MWQLRPVDSAHVTQLSRALEVSETVARLLWLRGYRTPEQARAFLTGRDDLSAFAEPIATPQMNRAVARLQAAFAAQEPIVVYGDYDADGVTAAALLYRYLKIGPRARVEAYLPDRFVDGYGLNAEAVRRLHAAGHRLIVTVDNGISAHEAAAVARELGVDLIVTDHHMLPSRLPEAYAIVHPQVDFPAFKDLSGVGVAFMLVIALEGGWHDRLRSMLDLVTLGSIADVVPLQGVNRPLVWHGLRHIRETTRLRPGLRALISVAGHVQAETITARNVAFSLAPMLNAAGRLEKPSLAFDLLVTNDQKEADRLAVELQAINEERRELDRTLADRLSEEIAKAGAHTQDPFLVLADAQFHHGVTGIVAGRLKERYGKPVLLLSQASEGVWKGSGRSPEGCHLFEALAHASDLLLGFGGHAQAAGCSVETAQIPALRERLNAYLAAHPIPAVEPTIWLDAAPPLSAYSSALLDALEQLEPTGQGNPAPTLGVLDARVVAQRTDRSGKHLFLKLDDGEAIAEAVAWGQAEVWHHLGGHAHARLRPRLKTFRGETKLELVIEQLEAVAARPAEPPGASAGTRLVDHRQAPNRLRVLRERLAAGTALAIYTGEQLPGLEIDRLVGQRPIAYWSDHQPHYGATEELVMWERPYSLEAWQRLTAGVSGAIHLLWEAPVVEPDLSREWLLAFHRELGGLTQLTWNQVLGRTWPTTSLMVRSSLEILREAGLLRVDGQAWELLSAPETLDLAALASYAAYREAHTFRLTLANGAFGELRRAVAREEVGALVG